MKKTSASIFARWFGVGVALCTIGCGGELPEAADDGERAAQLTGVDAVTNWNTIAQDAIVTVAKKPGSAAIIDIAIVQIAVYDAVNSISSYKYEPYAYWAYWPSWSSVDAAVAQSAHDVLLSLYPTQQATLDAQLATSLSAIPNGSAKSNGISAGQGAAQAILAARANDGRNDANVTYTPGTGAGAWQPTLPAFAAAQTPWVAKTKPFTMSSPSQFRPAGPDALTSTNYANDFNEVKLVGSKTSTVRTPAQTETATFWAEHSGAQYNRFLRSLSMAKDLSTSKRARMFAMVNTAAADSLIACLDAKYTYSFWRPVTAIRAADIDGNSATDVDALWEPLLTTPNHPEYLGAHGCLTSAVTKTLAGFFGTDYVSFDIDSTTSVGSIHHFNSFSAVTTEVIDARTWGGLHYRTSSVKGGDLGAKVANQLLYRYFDR